MPSSLGSALPLLSGAGCFSADAVESLGNCSLQCHCRPTYSWSPISTSSRPITYTLVPSTCNILPPVSRSALCLSSGCHPERSSRALLPFPRSVRARKRSRRTSLRFPPAPRRSCSTGILPALSCRIRRGAISAAADARRTGLATCSQSASCERVPRPMWSAGACSRCLPPGLAPACSSHQPTNTNLPIDALAFSAAPSCCLP